MNIIKEIESSLKLSSLSLIIFIIIIYIEPFIMKMINNINVIQIFLFYYISWHTIKMFFLGIFLAPIFLVIAYYVVSPVLAYEVLLEAKLFGLKLVKIGGDIDIDWVSVLTYAYMLFGPIIIVVRLVSILPSENIVYFYLVAWDLFMRNAFIVFLALLTPFWLREVSRVRELYPKFKIDYPSRFLKILAVILIGVGSITALVPLFMELLSIFRDILIATYLFIAAILLGYLPMLSMVLGWLINFRFIPKEIVMKPVTRFASIIERKLLLGNIEIT